MPKMIAVDELHAMLQSAQNGLTKLHEDPRFAHMASNIAAEITAVREIRKMIDRMDAVDAEPVVRCRDCKHSAMWDDHLVCGRISNVMIGYYHGTVEVVKPDDFCSHGERREDHE